MTVKWRFHCSKQRTLSITVLSLIVPAETRIFAPMSVPIMQSMSFHQGKIPKITGRSTSIFTRKDSWGNAFE